MRLSISNLSFPPECTAEAYGLLKSLGVDGIEVAPTRIGDWESLTAAMCSEEARKLSDFGLVVSSLQAILFKKPSLQLFGAETEFVELTEHIHRVAELGSSLGCKVAVFGAPKNRLRRDLSEADAFDLAVERFSKLSDVCEKLDFIIVVEPVPEFYGADFLTDASTTSKLVRAVGKPNVGLHLDTGCAYLGEDEIGTAISEGKDILRHFHIAEPKLAEFSHPVSSHKIAAAALREIGYDQWVAVEMLTAFDWRAAVTQAVVFSSANYGTSLDDRCFGLRSV